MLLVAAGMSLSPSLGYSHATPALLEPIEELPLPGVGVSQHNSFILGISSWFVNYSGA